jgi:hypothetical protein
MFDFTDAPVMVRSDLERAFDAEWRHLAGPGGSMSGEQRVGIAVAARSGGADSALAKFARHLYDDPASVGESDVRAAADTVGDPMTVETIGLVSRLSAVDRFHTVLGMAKPPLPQPGPGSATGEIQTGLKRRSGHVPMPPGSIPFSLDLIPAEGRALMEIHGPLYMTADEMGDPQFNRSPGLHRPQMELVAARTSLINECFF